MASNRVASLVERVRQPEYTGANRCLPCTATNLVIAVVLSGVLGYAAIAGGLGAAVGAGIGGIVFVLSVAAIYVRGYLVPGTPELTKQYFPEWLLALFGKADDRETFETDENVDVEAILYEAAILEEKPHGDLGLTESFEQEWYDQMEAERDEETSRQALADIIGVDAAGLEFQEFRDSAFVALYDDRRVGRWESRAAFLADAAAGHVLPDYYDDWDEASPAARGQILAGLRLFIEECPDCGGDVRFGQEIVESCCRSYPVIAVTCEACNARIFEIDASDELLEGPPQAEAA
jgi:hypothetical protein